MALLPGLALIGTGVHADVPIQRIAGTAAPKGDEHGAVMEEAYGRVGADATVGRPRCRIVHVARSDDAHQQLSFSGQRRLGARKSGLRRRSKLALVVYTKSSVLIAVCLSRLPPGVL